MKTRINLVMLLCLMGIAKISVGAEIRTDKSSYIEVSDDNELVYTPIYVKPSYMPHYALGLLTGIDLGGAVPWPISDGIGEDDFINAKVNVDPAVGIFYQQYFNSCWSLRAELTYKRYGIDATARVDNQKYKDPISLNTIYFKGTTELNMSFKMFELPIMVGYSFGRHNRPNTIMLGAFYAQYVDATFMASPQKGLSAGVKAGTSDTPDWEGADIVSPGELDPQIFDSYLEDSDYGFVVAYHRNIFERINVGARFAMGLQDVFRADSKCFEYKMLNMRGSIVIDYRILGK
ncbi:MAG: outer membrane beta-barrel protein [Rikenellaceae bacterium]